MGYSYFAGDSSFFIPADKKREALSALWDHAMKVRCETFEKMELEDELRESWGFECSTGDRDDIIDMFPLDSYLDSERNETLFNLLAPFVREGSYLMYYGEDGTQWGWRFREGKAQEEDVRGVFITDLTPEQRKTYVPGE